MWHSVPRATAAIVFLALGHAGASAQLESSRGRITEIAAGIQARVGVAVVDIETGDTLTVDGSGRYPMQSVYKFPLALAVLQRVDSGTLSLDRKVHVAKSDLRPDTWSPMRKKYPEGNVDIPLAEVIWYTVSLSDNNGCDILFRMMGGPDSVQTHIHAVGVTEIGIVSTEEEMQREESLQYRNWCSPAAMGLLLRKFYRGEVLSDSSTSFLRRIMEETTTGPRRIRGMLPEGTVVAHKTGSSGVDYKGLVAATNDVGVVTLPSGRRVAIAVFVSDARSEEKACEDVIARTARAVWDAYAAAPNQDKR